MPVIDPTTNIGKVRLRIADWRDLPILSDEIIQSALTECDNNVPRASALCAQYVLGTISSRTHRKLSSLETWGNEQFEQYVKFLQLTILNPNMMSFAPIPCGGEDTGDNPIVAFVADWNASYSEGVLSASV